MASATLWERTDEPVLRWVAALPSSLAMEIHLLERAEPQQVEGLPGLTSREVHESLQRLASYGLIDGDEGPPVASVTWSKLRVTAFGWIVLGEWPDLDRVASAASLRGLLLALADNAPEEERGPLRRAAGIVSRTTDDVVRSTAADIARTLGREAADG